MLLVATAGLATVTLSGCWCTSGNLVAPPEDSGVQAQPDAGMDAGPPDAGRDAGR